MSNPAVNAAGETARSSAELQQALADISLPALGTALSAYLKDLGAPGTEPASVASEFRAARETLMGEYSAEEERAKAAILQEAKSSGMNYSPAAVSEAVSETGRMLESGRARTLRSLKFQEANAGMAETNTLLSSINAGAGSVLGGAYRFGSNALTADQLLAQAIAQRQQQNSTYGSIAGTVLGGVLGYFAGNPVLGASLGSAAGGAVGGFIG